MRTGNALTRVHSRLNGIGAVPARPLSEGAWHVNWKETGFWDSADIHGHGDMGVGTPTGGKSFSLCLPSDSASFLYHGSIEYWLLQVNPKFGPTDWVKHCIPAPHLASLFFLGRRT